MPSRDLITTKTFIDFMNKYNAKDYLPLVQGLAEGKTLQFKSDQWEDIPCNSEFKWNNCPSHYRIKPEPRTDAEPRIWSFWLDAKGNLHAYNITPFSDWKRIEVQEVLE